MLHLTLADLKAAIASTDRFVSTREPRFIAAALRVVDQLRTLEKMEGRCGQGAALVSSVLSQNLPPTHPLRENLLKYAHFLPAVPPRTSPPLSQTPMDSAHRQALALSLFLEATYLCKPPLCSFLSPIASAIVGGDEEEKEEEKKRQLSPEAEMLNALLVLVLLIDAKRLDEVPSRSPSHPRPSQIPKLTPMLKLRATSSPMILPPPPRSLSRTGPYPSAGVAVRRHY